jgi:hypothetical protein
MDAARGPPASLGATPVAKHDTLSDAAGPVRSRLPSGAATSSFGCQRYWR